MTRKKYAKLLGCMYLFMLVAMFFDPYWQKSSYIIGPFFCIITWKREKDTNWPLSNSFLNLITGGLYGLFNFDRKNQQIFLIMKLRIDKRSDLMLRAVIYARFSSDMQREESIDAQVRACKSYCQSKGYLVVGQYVDQAKSGRELTKRDAYNQILTCAGTYSLSAVCR